MAPQELQKRFKNAKFHVDLSGELNPYTSWDKVENENEDDEKQSAIGLISKTGYLQELDAMPSCLGVPLRELLV